MDYTNTSQITVIPDAEEKGRIRLRYNKVAVVLIVNTVLFNVLAWAIRVLLTSLYGDAIWTDLVSTIYSCGVPIIAESVSIILGITMLKVDFKPAVTFNGYTGGTIMKLITLSIGLQTAASFIIAILAMILSYFGLEGATADLSATTSLPANLIMYFYACLLGPVLEELLYRGVILQSMRKYNERFAIFLSAAVFGLMHQNYQQALFGFIVGIPLAIVTIKSNSIIPAIFAHVFVNTFGTVCTCWMQYCAPELFDIAMGSFASDVSEFMTPDILIPLFSIFFIRIGFMLAALMIGIFALVKGNNMRRPTPAGKARTWPVFITAACWWIVFALYAYLNLIYPFK